MDLAPAGAAGESSTLIVLGPERSVFSEICNRVGESAALVGLVADSVAQRNLRADFRLNPEPALAALGLELEYCAKAYCGAAKTDDLVYDELVEFVVTQYGHLAVGEIREAFRLAAAGKLGEVNLASYYGLFTVAMLGEVLNAYGRYRQQIVAELMKVEKAMALPKRTWDSAAWAEQRLTALLGTEGLTVDHVTAFDYEYFHSTGQLTYTDEEKRAAWNDARGAALADLQRAAELEKNFFKQKEMRDLVARVVEGVGATEDNFVQRRTVLAKRLLVVRWIERLVMSDE